MRIRHPPHVDRYSRCPLSLRTARHLGTKPGKGFEGILYRAIGRHDTAVRVVAGGRNTDVEFSPGLDTTSFLVDQRGAVVLPLLATQILWINLITDTGPALAMGVDPIAEDIMARKPRPRGQRIIDARMWLGVLEGGVVMAVLTMLTLDLFLPGGLIEPVDTWLGPGPHSLEGARTTAFTVLVLTQLFNCFNARSATASAFQAAFSTRWLWVAVALSAGLQGAVVHLHFLNLAFGTVPLSAGQWCVCVSGVLWFSEERKLLRRLWTRRPLAPAGQRLHGSPVCSGPIPSISAAATAKKKETI
jgi:hypothetical protein